jgi:DNA-binding transcriptional LysR family regulator
MSLRLVALDALEGRATAAEVQAVLQRTNRGAVRQAGSAPSGEGTTNAVSPAPLGLLPILLARLRAEQPESNCFMCLTSDDPRDWCAEHLTRLDTVSAYGEAA